MLPPTRVIFTAVEGALLDPQSQSWSAAAEALEEIERRHVPLISGHLRHTSGTRAAAPEDRARASLRHRERRRLCSSRTAISRSGSKAPYAWDAISAWPLASPYADAVAAAEEIAEAIRGEHRRLLANDRARNRAQHRRNPCARPSWPSSANSASASSSLARRTRRRPSSKTRLGSAAGSPFAASPSGSYAREMTKRVRFVI